MPIRHSTAMKRSRFLMMLEASQRRAFCCCCVVIPRQERRQAKRIFRIARRAAQSWGRDRLEAVIAAEPPTPV